MLWVVPIYCGTGGDGKPRRKTVARKNRNQAILAARERVKELQEGVTGSARTMTLAQWLDYWIADVLPSRGLRPNTLRNYARLANNQIRPIIGGYKLADVGPAQVREMHAAHAKQGLSVKTAQQAHVILSMSLQDAMKDNVLSKNPARTVGKPKGETEPRDALTSDQAYALLQSAVDNKDPFASRWAAALILGARQGELLGLTWDRVDFETNKIDLSWALVSVGHEHGCLSAPNGDPGCGNPLGTPRLCPQKRPAIPRGYRCTHLSGPLVLAPPKTNSSKRVVAMRGPIRDVLLTQREEQTGPNPFNLVWTNPRTGGPMNPSSDHTNWKRALERAKLPAMPLHSARHTAATLMQEMGVDEATRMRIMGHNSVAMARNYAHQDAEHGGSAIENLGSLILMQRPVSPPVVDAEPFTEDDAAALAGIFGAPAELQGGAAS